MNLSKQTQSRLEEAKVDKQHEDEEYFRKHPEIEAAIRVISRVSVTTNYVLVNDCENI